MEQMDIRANDLGDLQIAVLQALWNVGEGTIYDLLEVVGRTPRPAYTTVLTVVRSLEKRGLVEHRLPKGSRQYLYKPLVSIVELQRGTLEDALQRLFDGSSPRLLRCLVESGAVTAADLREMQCLLEQALAARGEEPLALTTTMTTSASIPDGRPIIPVQGTPQPA
jgi:BlaI family transcriptional regulator, penicillinase repressor